VEIRTSSQRKDRKRRGSAFYSRNRGLRRQMEWITEKDRVVRIILRARQQNVKYKKTIKAATSDRMCYDNRNLHREIYAGVAEEE
jgi:hypothetical protein